MDYKYIKQLSDRYWKGETTLEEENILKTFFSQKDVPAELMKYRDLFIYEQAEAHTDVLGDDFDEKLMSMIDEPAPVKARTITMTHRLMPLFKAAAVVAILLTLGNAAQVPFGQKTDYSNVSPFPKTHDGVSVAMTDSAVIDSLQQSSMAPTDAPAATILK
jgi:hypothetical protein